MRKFLLFAVVVVTGVIIVILCNYKSENANPGLNEAKYKSGLIKFDRLGLPKWGEKDNLIRYLEINPDLMEYESGYYELDKQGNRGKVDKELLNSILSKNNYDFTGDDLMSTYTFYDCENKEDSKITVTIKIISLDSIVAGRVFEWLPEAAQILGEGGEGVFYTAYDLETGHVFKKSHTLNRSIVNGWDIISLNVLSVKPDDINVEASFINVEIDEYLSLYDQGKIWQDENRPPRIINF